jgi:hypothetical protein
MGALSPLLSTLLIADFIAAYVLKMLAFSGVQCFNIHSRSAIVFILPIF